MCMGAAPAGGGQQSTGGAALTGAASGASMGAVAGPWGAAAGAVVGAGMSIMSASASNKANKAYQDQQKAAQDLVILENRKRATHDYLREVRLEQLSEVQEETALGEKAYDISKATAATKGTAVASAAERGVSGQSLDTVLSEYEFQQNQEVGRLRINQTMRNAQHGENIGSYRDQFDERVSMAKPYIPRPQNPVDYYGPIFGAASTVAKAYMASGGGQTPTANAALATPGRIGDDPTAGYVGGINR
jgi:hypothetical protein